MQRNGITGCGRHDVRDFGMTDDTEDSSHWRCWRERGLAVAILYGVSSSSMAFVNKAVMNTYSFNYPFFILACQMVVTIVCLETCRIFQLVQLSKYTVTRGWYFCVPSLFYALHSALSLVALSGMNIPMYGALKRCTPLVNLVLSVVVLRKPYPSSLLIWSIIIITFGCLLAGFGDLSFSAAPYIMGSFSVVAQGLYLTLVERTAKDKHTTTEILHLNSFNTLPFFIVCSLFMNELNSVLQASAWTDVSFLVVFLVQISLGAVLNYLLFLCTMLTSALTTSLVGVAKSVVQTFIGFFTFGGVAINAVNISGITLNTFGGFLYTYAKYQERRALPAKHLPNGYSKTILPAYSDEVITNSKEMS